MIDLSLGRAALEDAMADTCRIERNPGGSADDVLDRTTGRVVPAAGPVVYEGPCAFLDRAAQEGDETPAEGNAVRTAYLLRLPLSRIRTEPIPGDVITCLTAAHDPGLPGVRFTADRADRSTYALSREIELRVLSWTSA